MMPKWWNGCQMIPNGCENNEKVKLLVRPNDSLSP